MRRWNANHYVAVACLIGLALMFCGMAGAAEREPFVAALVRCDPDKPCEVRHLYTERTACELDLPSAGYVAPAGSRLSCKPLRASARQ